MSDLHEPLERAWYEANRYCVKWEHYRTWTDDDPIDQATGLPKDVPPSGLRFKRYSIRLAGPIPEEYGPGPFVAEKRSFLLIEPDENHEVATYPFRTYAIMASQEHWDDLYKEVHKHKLPVVKEGEPTPHVNS